MPDIAIWNQCNNHCTMCTNPKDYQLENNSSEYSCKNIINRWTNTKLKRGEAICLTGGEPTIHPDFFEILHWFSKQYPKNIIAMASNGRLFYYEAFTRKVLRTNNLVLEIAIHGYNAKTHDAVTRVKGSFEQTIKGIHNILRYKNDSQFLEIRIIITKLTYKNLDKILEFLTEEFDVSLIRDVVLVFMEMEGQAQDNFKLVGLRYDQINWKVYQIAEKWSKSFNDFRLYHFPLCTLLPTLWPHAWRTLRGEEVTFVKACNNCRVKKYCMGIHRDYLKLIGEKEFHPVKNIKVRPSDFEYRPVKEAHQL
ncbi:MAG TPA: radical SAM protein [Candidatus Paceibacterota bacterium]|nr:radical SAM protein [Candidatus Paceibacterota bacterium]